MQAIEIGNRALDQSHKAIAHHLEMLHRRLRTAENTSGWPQHEHLPASGLPAWPSLPLRPEPWLRGEGNFSPYGEYRTFISHLSNHFVVEETILRAVGFGDYQAHCASHAALLRRLEEACAPLAPEDSHGLGLAVSRKDASRRPQPFAILAEIEDMIYDHELLQDSLYWDALNGKKAWALVQWDETFSIGDRVLDAHHHGLLCMTNRLSLAADAVTRGEFMEMVQEFYDLAHYHFRIEERHLAQDPVLLTEHRRLHHALLRSLRTMGEAVRDGSLTAHQFVNDFLLFWLLDHVQKGDTLAFEALAATTPKD